MMGELVNGILASLLSKLICWQLERLFKNKEGFWCALCLYQFNQIPEGRSDKYPAVCKECEQSFGRLANARPAISKGGKE